MTEDRSLRRVREVQDRYREVLDHLKEKDQARDVQIQAKLQELQEKSEAHDEQGLQQADREFYALLEQQKREFREDVAEIESAGLEGSIIRAEAAIEGSKHRAEALKQQATYSAAAILGITAITRGPLPSGQVLTTLL
jgi:acetoin utilization deacetylase AcuC-like enzyme